MALKTLKSQRPRWREATRRSSPTAASPPTHQQLDPQAHYHQHGQSKRLPPELVARSLIRSFRLLSPAPCSTAAKLLPQTTRNHDSLRLGTARPGRCLSYALGQGSPFSFTLPVA